MGKKDNNEDIELGDRKNKIGGGDGRGDGRGDGEPSCTHLTKILCRYVDTPSWPRH